MTDSGIPPWLADTIKDDAYIPTNLDIRHVEPQSITEMLLKYICLYGGSLPTYLNLISNEGDSLITSEGHILQSLF
ncbi:hypothetical protein FACS189465_0490 [Clostridia bacterium]|nr:hypothetical protein FACS189465_0490 [Clostridia bacterium]